MRLLSVIHGPAFGGAHNQARCLAAPLRDRGVETVVMLPSEAEAAAKRLRAAGVETLTMTMHRLRATPSPPAQLGFLRSLVPETRALAETIARLAIDVVQVHGATNPLGAMAARRAGAGVVWQIFDTRAPMALRRLAMPFVVRRADAITTWGDELARVHPGVERLGERWITVFPPVEADRFGPDEKRRAEARARFGFHGDEPVVGTIGVLNPQKGHEYLIRAAELVRQSRPDVRFLILGGSSPAHADYEAGLRAEARRRGLADALRFADPGTEVDLLVQGFDIFAMTSVPRSEGMPTAILEAMTCAKPVISTDVGAVRELVDDGVTGLIVEPEDPGVVAEAALALLAEPARMASLGAAGRRRAQTEFSLERLADLHAAAYEIAARRGDAQ